MSGLVKQIADVLGRFAVEPMAAEPHLRVLRRKALRRNDPEAIAASAQAILMLLFGTSRHDEIYSVASAIVRLRGTPQGVREIVLEFCGSTKIMEGWPSPTLGPEASASTSCRCCNVRLEARVAFCATCSESAAAAVLCDEDGSLHTVWGLARTKGVETYYRQIEVIVPTSRFGHAFLHLLMADAFQKMGLPAEAILQSSEAILSDDCDEAQRQEALRIMFGARGGTTPERLSEWSHGWRL